MGDEVVLYCPSVTKPICFKDGKKIHQFYGFQDTAIDIGLATLELQGFYVCRGQDDKNNPVVCNIELLIASK